MRPSNVEQHAVKAVAQSNGVADDGLEHGLCVGLRAADGPQDLAGGRLLFEGPGEVAVAGVELL